MFDYFLDPNLTEPLDSIEPANAGQKQEIQLYFKSDYDETIKLEMMIDEQDPDVTVLDYSRYLERQGQGYISLEVQPNPERKTSITFAWHFRVIIGAMS